MYAVRARLFRFCEGQEGESWTLYCPKGTKYICFFYPKPLNIVNQSGHNADLENLGL